MGCALCRVLGIRGVGCVVYDVRYAMCVVRCAFSFVFVPRNLLILATPRTPHPAPRTSYPAPHTPHLTPSTKLQLDKIILSANLFKGNTAIPM